MENLFVLPTDKPSRLVKNGSNVLLLTIQTLPLDVELGCFPHNICITNDELPKLDEWGVNNRNGVVFKCKGFTPDTEDKKYDRKIILTTDQDLIADGVQAIDDDFLEWFVKNSSCEEVEVEKGYRGVDLFNYKIIIPKEELERGITITHVGKGESNPFELPKALPDDVFYKSLEPKQETLEEFAKQEAIKKYSEDTFGNLIVRKSIEKGAKWQQERMYNEEEVESFLNNIISEIKVRKENIEKNQDKMPIHLLEGGLMAFESSIDVIKDLFEQFKKK